MHHDPIARPIDFQLPMPMLTPFRAGPCQSLPVPFPPHARSKLPHLEMMQSPYRCRGNEYTTVLTWLVTST